jgi:C-terminal processing protease CtpA/Prc
MKHATFIKFAKIGFLGCVIFLSSFTIFSQNLKNSRSKFQDVIKLIKSEIQKKYFDPGFRGINLEEKAEIAIDLIKQANSEGEMMTIVANFLLEFNDSHLTYIPPIRVSDTDYGWEMSMVGEKCLVTGVSPGSDAEAQGLKVGDEIYTVEGFIPTRENFWKIRYFYQVLINYPALNVFVIKPDGKKFQYVLKAKITKGSSVVGVNTDDWKKFDWRLQKLRGAEAGHQIFDGVSGVVVWKMPAFDLQPGKVDDIFGKLKEKDALILDLRGNSGGYVETVLRLIGNVFSEDLTVGMRKTRKETKEQVARTRGKNSFKGRIAVLIDSDSASASEVFARVIQLEKRGIVLGDLSAGMVMESQITTYKDGVDDYSLYAVNMTVADLIMKDGQSLEKKGVQPDEKILPTQKDVAAGRDVVLARAFEAFGFSMTPEEAGKIFARKK